MATWAENLTTIETAIETVLTGIATDAEVVEYEIGGTRVRKKPTTEVLESLLKSRNMIKKLAEEAAASASGGRSARVFVPRGAV